jgi:hypothetical protein
MSPASGAAAPKDRDWAALDAQVERLARNGASQQAIDAFFAARGIQRVDSGTEGTIQPASTKSNVTLVQPTIYFDQRYNQWVARAKFNWKHNCPSLGRYKDSCSFIDCPGYQQICGGDDGFALRFNREVEEVDSAFYTYDTDGYAVTPFYTNPAQQNGYGTSWVEQDRNRIGPSGTNTYNWDSGILYYFFKRAIGCTKGTAWKLYSDLGHTWSSAAINGFGVGPYSFSISWNTYPEHWESTLPSPTTWYPCGL